MIKVILTDIEGTTSSISFVKDVLFPYARKHMGEFIHRHAMEPSVLRELEAVRQHCGRTMNTEEIIQQLTQWIDEDKKITPLKSLQGMIWKDGYSRGDFTGHIYEDAVRNLKKWKGSGFKLYIFSSGSVQAQKLLFAHTDYGDLTPLFSGYFDTTIGNKREAVAYQKIAEAIGAPAGDILFLSDTPEELDAAHGVGMRTLLLARDSNQKHLTTTHRQTITFDEISP